ncbi:hypothetical protein OIU84_002891 [Salix udensis]|uniref:Uncharacterized protein n=1 Tax=Salix udensis TaxID=889485 RepID=A0AAD6P5S8_9ROSI|nr:hypothetical protein OIU84_002891 [Salix udensis]
MACMLLVGGFMPKSAVLLRLPSTRLCFQRKTLITRARRGAEVSHGGGGQINQARKSMDAARMADEKLRTAGSFDSGKENKNQIKEKVDDGTTVSSLWLTLRK